MARKHARLLSTTRLLAATVSSSEPTALVCSLNTSNPTCPQHWRLLLRSYVLRESVHNRFVSPSTRALCNPPLLFPSSPHLRAALETQPQRIPSTGGHSCEVMCCAEACATGSDRLRQPNPVGLCVAHHFCSRSRRTYARSRKLKPNAFPTPAATFVTLRVARKHA